MHKRRKDPMPPLEAMFRAAALCPQVQVKVCRARADTNPIKRSHDELRWVGIARTARETMLKMIGDGTIPVYAVRTWPTGNRMYLALQCGSDVGQRVWISRTTA